MHPLISQVTGTGWIEGSRDAGYGLSTAAEQVQAHRPDVVFVTSPNNPTGTSVPLALIEEVYDAAPGLVVVDEAYAEFVRAGTPSALTAAARQAAARGLPHDVEGLRRRGHQARLPRRRPGRGRRPAPGAAAVSPVHGHPGRRARRHRATRTSRSRPSRRSAEAATTWSTGSRGHGLTVADSDANFVLFGVFDDRDAVWQGLLDRGVLIRNTGPKGWLRVTVGTPAENDAFKQALKEDRNL